MKKEESGFPVKIVLGGITIISLSAFLFRYHKQKEIQELKREHEKLKLEHEELKVDTKNVLKWFFYQIHKNGSENVDLSLNISSLEKALVNSEIKVPEENEFRSMFQNQYNREFQLAFTGALPGSLMCINFLQDEQNEVELIGNPE